MYQHSPTNDVFLEKAEQCLAGAQSEYAGGRYNNCANRSYYACFQAAIFALIQVGIRPLGTRNQWGHDFVQAQWAAELVNRRKLYPAEVRDAVERTYVVRQSADYGSGHISATQASRALRRAVTMLELVRQGGMRR